MRRLAAKTRDDEYASRRDYQTIHAARSQRFRVKADGASARLTLTADVDPSQANTDFVAFGGYISPFEPMGIQAFLLTKMGDEPFATFRVPFRLNRLGWVLSSQG